MRLDSNNGVDLYGRLRLIIGQLSTLVNLKQVWAIPRAPYRISVHCFHPPKIDISTNILVGKFWPHRHLWYVGLLCTLPTSYTYLAVEGNLHCLLQFVLVNHEDYRFKYGNWRCDAKVKRGRSQNLSFLFKWCRIGPLNHVDNWTYNDVYILRT